jgi:hypothetical protein
MPLTEQAFISELTDLVEHLTERLTGNRPVGGETRSGRGEETIRARVASAPTKGCKSLARLVQHVATK